MESQDSTPESGAAKWLRRQESSRAAASQLGTNELPGEGKLDREHVLNTDVSVFFQFAVPVEF